MADAGSNPELGKKFFGRGESGSSCEFNSRYPIKKVKIIRKSVAEYVKL